jgi:hypothetical protein
MFWSNIFFDQLLFQIHAEFSNSQWFRAWASKWYPLSVSNSLIAKVRVGLNFFDFNVTWPLTRYYSYILRTISRLYRKKIIEYIMTSRFIVHNKSKCNFAYVRSEGNFRNSTFFRQVRKFWNCRGISRYALTIWKIYKFFLIYFLTLQNLGNGTIYDQFQSLVLLNLGLVRLALFSLYALCLKMFHFLEFEFCNNI